MAWGAILQQFTGQSNIIVVIDLDSTLPLKQLK